MRMMRCQVSSMLAKWCGIISWVCCMMMGVYAGAATVTFTGLSGSNLNFSAAGNWDSFPNTGDIVQIAVTNTAGIATASNAPALIDAAFTNTLGTAKIYSQTGYGTGMAYAEIAYGALLKAGNLNVGNPGNAAFDGTLTLRKGGSVDTTAANSGTFSIGGETVGMCGEMIVENSAALFRQSRLQLFTYGTLTFEFGSNSVSTLQTIRTTAGANNTLNGLLRVDLAHLTVGGTYTLIDSSSTNLLIAGNLRTWLDGNGGCRSGTGSFSTNWFEVCNGGDMQWTLSLADSGRDLTLTVTPGTTRYAGNMNRFWRQFPVMDRWLTGGNGLLTVPDYFYESDFPYISRPYSNEVLFADRLILVRLLGGWIGTGGELNNYTNVADADLFYRTGSNTLAYRMNLLPPRLDQYIAYGYDDLTIVLDNTPWTLPVAAVTNLTYGNTAPPQYNSWFYWGVRKLIQTIRTEYGTQTTARLRFRMGTENQETNRFFGTQVDYFKLYDWAEKAVKDELPFAGFFPFNLAGGASIATVTNHNVNYFELASHCEAGSNYATGSTGASFDNVPTSLYFCPVWVGGDLRLVDPDETATNRIGVWNKIEADYPSLRFKRSVHEFGIIGTEDDLDTDEPGARGCAQRFQALVALLEGGLDESVHWTVTDKIPKSGTVPEYHLMKGEAWLYSIFDHLSGNPAYTLPVAAVSTNGTRFRSLTVCTSSNTVLFISSFNIFRTCHDMVTCQVDVPKSLIRCGGAVDTNAEAVLYDRSTAIHDLLRGEFASTGILTGGYTNSPDTCAEVYLMAGDNGRNYVRANWTSWIRSEMVDSLVLKSFQTVYGGAVEDIGDAYRVTVTLETPSVLAVVLE